MSEIKSEEENEPQRQPDPGESDSVDELVGCDVKKTMIPLSLRDICNILLILPGSRTVRRDPLYSFSQRELWERKDPQGTSLFLSARCIRNQQPAAQKSAGGSAMSKNTSSFPQFGGDRSEGFSTEGSQRSLCNHYHSIKRRFSFQHVDCVGNIVPEVAGTLFTVSEDNFEQLFFLKTTLSDPAICVELFYSISGQSETTVRMRSLRWKCGKSKM
jgi:hypothetical protein